VPKRCTLIIVIKKCCTPSVFVSVWNFGFVETGIARCSPPGTTTEVQRVGFPSAEIWFNSAGTRAMLVHWTGPRNGRYLRKPILNLETLYKPLDFRMYISILIYMRYLV
jgi:hypothetical protein